MGLYGTYLAKAEDTAILAAKAQDPIMRRTLQEMETIYRLLAQLAAPSSDTDGAQSPDQERQDVPFYGTLIDGSDHRH